MKLANIRVMFIHGNGGATANEGWQPQVAAELQAAGLRVINQTFPDNNLASASVWLPHIAELGAGPDTVLIGHSSGALAAMRFAERHQVLGSVLIGACHTDLGDEHERASGYYDAPWQWDSIRTHQRFILQYASTDDPYIPIDEARFVHEKLGTTYHEYTDRGHFLTDSFPELAPAILAQLQIISAEN